MLPHLHERKVMEKNSEGDDDILLEKALSLLASASMRDANNRIDTEREALGCDSALGRSNKISDGRFQIDGSSILHQPSSWQRVTHPSRSNKGSKSSVSSTFRFHEVNPGEETKVATRLLQAAAADAPSERPHILLVLVGLPGSGKSTVSAKIRELSPDRWRVCSQDALGNRHRVEAAVRDHFGLALPREGVASSPGGQEARGWKGAVVDRCNFDEEQRGHWMRIALQLSCLRRPVLPICVCLPRGDDAAFCLRRAQMRGADDVHSGDEDWHHIVSSMSRNYSPPHPREGYLGTYWLSDAEGIWHLLSLLSALEC